MKSSKSVLVALSIFLAGCKTGSGSSDLAEAQDPQIDGNQKFRINQVVSNATAALSGALKVTGQNNTAVASPELLSKTTCIIAIRVERGAILLGGSGGEGLMSCRTGSGWSAPSFVQTGGFDLGVGIGFESLQSVVFVAEGNLAKSMRENGSFQVNTYARAIAGDSAAALKSLQQYGLAVVQTSNGGLYAGVGVSFNNLSHAEETRNQPVYGEILGGGVPADAGGRECSTYVLPMRRNGCIADWEKRTGKKVKRVSSTEILALPADSAPMLTKLFNDQLRTIQ